MLADADDDVEVSRRSAVGSGIPFAGDADALPVTRAWLHPHLQRFGALHHPVTVASRADALGLARATAMRARHVELHAPAGLRHLAFALAFRARSHSAY